MKGPAAERWGQWAGGRWRTRLDGGGEADGFPTDDVFDAAAAAWSAHRIATGTAQCLPTAPEHDAHGRPVAIRY